MPSNQKARNNFKSCCATPDDGFSRVTGVETQKVALVGNPNSGKTTLFNALTGGRQKVGNYPGVTVERVSGQLKGSTADIECIDLPGIYSLQPLSEDEQVAVQALQPGMADSPDLIIYVLDSTNLERNLYLFARLVSLQLNTIVALTMVDRLESQSVKIDIPKLQESIGVPVFPIVGSKEIGIDRLRQGIAESLAVEHIPLPEVGIPTELLPILQAAQVELSQAKIEMSLGEILQESLSANEFNLPISPNQNKPGWTGVLDSVVKELETKYGSVSDLDIGLAYQWAAEVQRTTSGPRTAIPVSLTDKIDRVLTHRVYGMVMFVVVMYVVFQSIYTFAQPVMDLITLFFAHVSNDVRPLLEWSPILQSLVCDGVIGGVGAMLVFLPQILILFFFIAILEGSGYLARAAFLMDRLFGWCGLNGRAFIPLLSSFACAIPGIMAARVMPDKNSRLATILVAPLMSCSARLPVYLLLIGAFIEPKYGPAWAGFALFAMHLLGLAIAIPIVWFLNRKVIKGKRLPFVLELPPYQMPKWKDVFTAMYIRGKVFVTVAGTTIVFMSVLIWTLSYFPRSNSSDQDYKAQILRQQPSSSASTVQNFVDQQRLAHSYLGRFGQTIEPIFRPAGFDWRITTGILAAFPARETVIPSLGILFKLGTEEGSEKNLPQALAASTWDDGKPLLNPFSAVGLMVFFALCCQCNSTLATVRRETNTWKWPLFMFTYMTTLAYIFAVGINQLGIFLNRH